MIRFRVLNFLLATFIAVLSLRDSASTAKNESSRLKAVQIVYRHGNREPPVTVFTTAGLQLTSEGKKEIFELGKYFRKRYSSFLSPEFYAEEASFISSDLDRTLQSAMLFSYGLYKDSHANAKWYSGDGRRIEFDPVPVHSIPTEHDRFIQSTKACPRYDRLFLESMGICYDTFVDLNPGLHQEYIDLIDNDLLHDPLATGLAKIDIFVAYGEQIIYNITQNLPLTPEAEYLYKKYPNLLHTKAFCLSLSSDTVEKQRLYSGSLLKLLHDNFKEENTKLKKLTAFSAHDRTLFGLLITLAGWKELMPPTAASLILELYEDEASNLRFIEMWYRNSTEHDPFPATLPGCDHRCSIDTFTAILNPVFPQDFDKECAERQD